MAAEALAIATSLESVTRSLIFGSRNIDKSANGQAREGAAVGQIKNVFNEAAKLDGIIGRGAQSALNAFSTFTKSSKPLEYFGKAVDFAAKNVNPLICISAGIDVLNSDDKEYTLTTDAAGLAAMFGTEHLMKKHLGTIVDSVKEDALKIQEKSKFAKEIIEAARKVGKGKLTPIIKGIAFVAGSCTAYSVGEQFGKLLIGREKMNGYSNSINNQVA